MTKGNTNITLVLNIIAFLSYIFIWGAFIHSSSIQNDFDEHVWEITLGAAILWTLATISDVSFKRKATENSANPTPSDALLQ